MYHKHFPITCYLSLLISLMPPSANADNSITVEQYQKTVQNLATERFLQDAGESVISGDFSSSAVVRTGSVWTVLARAAEVGGVASAVIDIITFVESHLANSLPSCSQAQIDSTKNSQPKSDTVYVYVMPVCKISSSGPSVNPDPQKLFLISSYLVNGHEELNSLIAEAKKPENIIFQKYLPDFMGGSIITGSSAFSGITNNEQSNKIEGSDVGFFVIELTSGKVYLAPTAMFNTLEDIAAFDSLSLDLSPVIQHGESRKFEAHIEEIILALDTKESLDAFVTKTGISNTGETTFVCPEKFPNKSVISRTYTNSSSVSNLFGLEILVNNLTYKGTRKHQQLGPVLVVNEDGGLGGIGTRVKIQHSGDFSDGILSSGESIDVPFTFCSKNAVKTINLNDSLQGLSLLNEF